jgi:hypothetical protein
VGIRVNKNRLASVVFIGVLAGLPLLPLPSGQFTIGILLLMVLVCVLHPYLMSYDRTTQGRQCACCGYDLKGVASQRCPECGGATKA